MCPPRSEAGEPLATRLRRARPERARGRRRGPGKAAEPADVSGAILDAVRRFPGLTCEGVAHVTAIATDRIKPDLAALTESGEIRKVGRTRGTRHHPA